MEKEGRTEGHIMTEGTFRYQSVALHSVTREDVPMVQGILDHAAYYHANIVQVPAAGMAGRCFEAEVPRVEGTRVYKHFFYVEDSSLGNIPLAALDLFVGFPNYKTASVAMLVIRDEYQRKGLGGRLLTETIPAFLRAYHPAVEWLSVSLTENNVPALRCLLKSQFERMNRWEKLDIKGRPIIALTYRRSVREP